MPELDIQILDEALMTGDEYIALLIERQRLFAAGHPGTQGAQAWLEVPPLEHFVQEGDEQLVRPEVLAKPAPQPKRAPAPVDVDRLRARRSIYAERLENARRALTRAERMRESARELGGGLISFGTSGPQGARKRVQAATERGLRAHSEATARIEHWEGRIRSIDRRIARAEQREAADA